MMVEEDISQLIFILFTSHFSLFLAFSLSFFLLFVFFCLKNTSKFQKNLDEIRIWRFWFLKRVCNKCEV